MCVIVCFMSLLQKVYKDSYEKSRGFSINYCDTPKFKMDSVLKDFTDVRINNELTSPSYFIINC